MPIREVKKPDVTIMIKKAGKRDPDPIWLEVEGYTKEDVSLMIQDTFAKKERK